ncbi:YycH family regulatory protein [Lederbergia lenta]|uniref:YycH family protein n=1 Tax=Lederbergia lenta TaxID=1467 RepID=A0A2X4WLE3_LEDLE|nr:two-component system activity regulator YycH [Lederbergia lenta]MCM3112803.1 two-component system activity regulator YycH [Lederbergia lenta]MEC2326230.1 two-component system activity regulator YycH [Lederbergia lenta]SQI63723.1 YycH family protein [Lederbergia lenta]
MRYETIKSVVLLLLVVASAALTWSLWTYQPQLESSDKKNVHEVSISNQEEPDGLIKPNRVLFHLDNVHYGTVKDKDIDPLINEIRGWNFYDISQAKVLSDARIHDISHTNNNVEIYFPDLVPFELYKGVLHVETNNVPNAAFNRIVINLASDSQDGATIYFVNTKENRVFESHVNPERISALITKINDDKKKYEKYGEYTLPSNQTIFLPENKTKLDEYKYYADYIDPEKFKNALFKDPSAVRRDILANGEKFTDISSMMNVDYNTNMIFYINPGQDPGTLNLQESDKHVLNRSIDFVNEHSGWTDKYRYFSLGSYQQTTVFQLFIQGRPVFNEDGMTEIRQVWGAEEIYKYRRPYFSLDISIPLTDKKSIELPSGEEVLNYLKESSDIQEDIDLLEDIMIGYKLAIDPENPKVFVLEPSWFYLYGGSWLRLTIDDTGGDFLGLE